MPDYGIVYLSYCKSMQTLKIKINLALCLFMSVFFLMAAPVMAADPCSNTLGSDGKVDQTKVQNCLTQSPVVHRIQQIVDFLSVGVGIVVVGVILVGGIQYIVAGDNPQALTAARQRITNGLIALFAFIFMSAFLQWLIPGGIFK